MDVGRWRLAVAPADPRRITAANSCGSRELFDGSGGRSHESFARRTERSVPYEIDDISKQRTRDRPAQAAGWRQGSICFSGKPASHARRPRQPSDCSVTPRRCRSWVSRQGRRPRSCRHDGCLPRCHRSASATGTFPPRIVRARPDRSPRPLSRSFSHWFLLFGRQHA